MKNFKKIISAALCAAMVFGIASCGKTGETKHHRDDDIETEASKREGGDVITETTEITITETEVTVTESSETETQEATERPTASAPVTTFETDGNFDPDFTFSTTDRVGNEWNESVFANAEVTMINFWEPWCSPCVNEMPDLEKLYENYQDQGFQIIGVYSETGMEYEVDQILKDCHTTYPILLYTTEFDQFQTGYVPTTIFVDSKGHVLDIPGGDNVVIGGQSYRDWEAIVKKLLG